MRLHPARRGVRLALAVVLVLVAACSDRDPEAVRTSPRPRAEPLWLVVTDVHFNPFADPELVADLATSPASQWSEILAQGAGTPSGYGDDTNGALLASALASMEETVPRPEVVFLVGDLLAHDFSDLYMQYAPDKSEDAFESFVDTTVEFLAIEFGASFPEAQFVPVLGNNDSYCGDYQTTPGSPFLARFVSSWGDLVDRDGRAPDFARTFPRAGYYEARLPGSRSTVFALNSVYWSAKYSNACGKPGADPGAAELRWLQTRLRSAAGSLWMVSHVPPGIDVFASTRSSAPVTLLASEYQARLLDLLGSPSRWTLAVHGHLHMDTFRLLAQPGSGILPEAAVASLGAPSISPVFSNNPAYVVLRLTPSRSAVRDYSAMTLDLGDASPDWADEYSFADTYGVQGVDTAAYLAVQRAIAEPSDAQTAYQRHYTSGSPHGSIGGRAFGSYWCGNVAMTPDDFTSCVSSFPPR